METKCLFLFHIPTYQTPSKTTYKLLERQQFNNHYIYIYIYNLIQLDIPIENKHLFNWISKIIFVNFKIEIKETHYWETNQIVLFELTSSILFLKT